MRFQWWILRVYGVFGRTVLALCLRRRCYCWRGRQGQREFTCQRYTLIVLPPLQRRSLAQEVALCIAHTILRDTHKPNFPSKGGAYRRKGKIHLSPSISAERTCIHCERTTSPPKAELLTGGGVTCSH